MRPILHALLLPFSILFFNYALAQAPQRQCYSHEYLQEKIRENPAIAHDIEGVERHTQAHNSHSLHTRGNAIIVPVVVHIVYRASKAEENITDAQVLSQIAVLNKDYRRLNPDRLKTPSVFKPVAADCGIEFQLAVRNPKGKSTTGIMRYQSDRTTPWGKDDEVKLASKGGIEPWDAGKYLNIWVCNIGNSVLGYSTMPGKSPVRRCCD